MGVIANVRDNAIVLLIHTHTCELPYMSDFFQLLSYRAPQESQKHLAAERPVGLELSLQLEG